MVSPCGLSWDFCSPFLNTKDMESFYRKEEKRNREMVRRVDTCVFRIRTGSACLESLVKQCTESLKNQ